jgi:hypothetical protein
VFEMGDNRALRRFWSRPCLSSSFARHIRR